MNKESTDKKNPDLLSPEVFEALWHRSVAAKAYLSGELEAKRKEKASAGGRSWAILRYERILDPDQRGLPLFRAAVTRPKTFEKHLRYLKKNCNVLPLEELLLRLAEGAPIPDKSVAITIDGGHRCALTNALPLLLEYQLPATFTLATAYIDSDALYYEDRMLFLLQICRRLKVKVPRLDFLEEPLREQLLADIAEVSPDNELTEQVITLLLRALHHTSDDNRKKANLLFSLMLGDTVKPPRFQDFLTWNEVSLMSERGAQFAMMGHWRVNPLTIADELIVRDFSEAYKQFAARGIEPLRTYVLPFGEFDPRVIHALGRIGVKLTLALGELPAPGEQAQSPKVLGRVAICEGTAASTEIFAGRLWALKLGQVQF